MKEEFREYSQKYLQLNRDRKIIFDPDETPFFPVAPRFSRLEKSTTVEAQLKEKYPDLKFIQGCLVDGAVLIADILPFLSAYDFETAETVYNLTQQLNRTSKITLQVVDAGTLNYQLLQVLDPFSRIRNPLLIFPGEGARIMANYCKNLSPSFDLERAVFLPCQRVKREKEFEILADYSPLPEKIDTERVVIVDDVVATGLTTQAIAGELKKRYGNIKVIVATWLFLNPTTKENQASPSGIKNVNITVATLALKGNYVARPPINSLSCFIRNGDKYDRVKEAFIEKYIEDESAFKRVLEEMRR